MAHSNDAAFVDQLRGMAAVTPAIAVPGAATIVRACRRRKARRNSIATGAFGVALLASAGFATMPHTTVVPEAAVAPVTISQPAEVGVQPVMPLETRAISPTDITLSDDSEGFSPLATGLGIGGTASLATAAALAIKSRKLAPAKAKTND